MRTLRYYQYNLRRSDLARPFTQRMVSTGSLFAMPVQRQAGLADIVLRTFEDTAWGDLPEAMRNDPDRVVALVNEIPAPATEADGTVYDPRSGADGHLSVLASTMQLDGGARQFGSDLRLPLFGAFSAFPNGIVLVPEELGPGYVAADDKVAFLRDEHAMIEAFRVQAFDPSRPARSMAGNYVVLGNGSLIRVVAHQTAVNPDGTVTTVWHAQTTSFHVFDGNFVWAWRFDPATGRLDCLGVQAGKHPFFDADRLNVSAGGALHHYNNRAGRYFLSAYADGQTVITGDRRLVTDPALRMMGATLAAGDLFSPIAQALRQANQPNTQAEVLLLDGDTLERLAAEGPDAIETADLPVADAAGVLIDGVPLAPAHGGFGTPDGPAGTAAAEALADRLTEYTRNQSTYDQVRGQVVDFAAKQLAGEWSTGTRDELVGRLLEDPATRLQLDAIVAGAVLDPIADQLAASIAATGADPTAAAQVEAQVREGFRQELTAPLLGPDGPLRVALRLEVLDQQLATIDRAALDQRASQAAAAQAREAAAIDELEHRVPKDAQEREEIERELAQHREAEQAAADDAARYEAQQHDLDNADEIRRGEQDLEGHGVRELFPGGELG